MSSPRPAHVRSVLIGATVLCSLWIGTAARFLYADSSSSCPFYAIAIEPGASIQAAVDRAGDGAGFCLKSGIHRAQAIRPRSKQRFYGEDRTVLNGSRLLTEIGREGGYWVVESQLRPSPKHGECPPGAPTCNQPEALFIDDKPLVRMPSKVALTSGQFYIDYAGGKIYLADNPTSRKLEVTVAPFAFESFAADVSISKVTVEKYASPAQKGAIHANEGAGWSIEDSEVRLNSGAGISVGTGSRVRRCDIHHNGQIGIAGNGKDIRIEESGIWANNIYGFDPIWQVGGAKIVLSGGVVFRRNHVNNNKGPGCWCDIGCLNTIYGENIVESNRDIGIFHEISFNAIIRKNVLRHNGSDERGWFWGADILIAGSEDVEVTGNTLVVAPGRCWIMLVDQGRRSCDGRTYQTRRNTVLSNKITYEGAACSGGVSDAKPGGKNFGIIADGRNLFDDNTYRVPHTSEPARFVWAKTSMIGTASGVMARNGAVALFRSEINPTDRLPFGSRAFT